MAADDEGVYLAGSVLGTLEGQCRSGGLDLQVSRFDFQGTRLWRRQLGTAADDQASVISAAPGKLFVAGGPAPFSFLAALDKDLPSLPSGPRIHNECVVNGANYVGGAIAPGEILTIFGDSLGPPGGVQAHLSQDSPLPYALADTRVLFNGVAGALLYVSSRQTNAIAPYALTPGASVEVVVEYKGERSNAVMLPVQPAHLGVFSLDGSGQGPAAAWNEDGTLNSVSNPAHPGSAITFYATGARLQGQMSEARAVTSPAPPAEAVGQVALSQPYPEIEWNWDDTPSWALIWQRPAAVYARGVPGSNSGLIEIQFRLPDFPAAVWCLQVFGQDGSYASGLATIAVTGNE